MDTCHHPREWQSLNKESGDILETLEAERKMVGHTESQDTSCDRSRAGRGAEIDQERHDKRLTGLDQSQQGGTGGQPQAVSEGSSPLVSCVVGRRGRSACSFWLDMMQNLTLCETFLQISLGSLTLPSPPQIRGHLWVPLRLHRSVRWTAGCLALHGQILCRGRAHVPLLVKHPDRSVQKRRHDHQHRVPCPVQCHSAGRKGEWWVS